MDHPVRGGYLVNGLKTMGMLALATLINAFLVEIFHIKDNVSQIYILAVLLVASHVEGYFWGILAAAIGVIGTNYFFTFPYFSLDFTLHGYPIMFLIMLVVATIASTMVTRIKEQRALAQAGEKRTQELNYINERLICIGAKHEIIKLLTDYLQQFAKRDVFFAREQDGEVVINGGKDATIALFDADECQIAWQAIKKRTPTGAGTEYGKESSFIYLPIVLDQRVFGIVAILCKKQVELEQESIAFIQLILSQFAMAFEQQRLTDEHQKAIVEKEKERIGSNLLRAISHDLRTPLTGILGASMVIKENGDSLPSDRVEQLVNGIYEDAQWLLRMVENLLSITRMSQGDKPQLNKQLEAVEEVVAQAVERSKKRFSHVDFRVKIPETFIMAPMDAILIEQVILNLLENAVRHGGSSERIELSIAQDHDEVVIQVRDYGRGLTKQELLNLFEEFATRNHEHCDNTRGLGLGLSICKTIIEAHGGKITGKNGIPNGAIFTFTLPIKEIVYDSSKESIDC